MYQKITDKNKLSLCCTDRIYYSTDDSFKIVRRCSNCHTIVSYVETENATEEEKELLDF